MGINYLSPLLLLLLLCGLSSQATLGSRSESTAEGVSRSSGQDDGEADVVSVGGYSQSDSKQERPQPRQADKGDAARPNDGGSDDRLVKQVGESLQANLRDSTHAPHEPNPWGHEQSSFGTRSVDNYWHSVMGPSRELERRNIGYRIKNDLRARLEQSQDPLHSGHIYTGDIGNPFAYDIRDRPFGIDSDFNLPEEINAFKYKPYGPRLTREWVHAGWPVLSHNLYRLRESMMALGYGRDGATDVVNLPPGGVYKFSAVSPHGDLVIQDVETKQRFLINDLFTDPGESRKFQALGPWVDPGGGYFSLAERGQPFYPGLPGSYVIKGSPITTNDPTAGNHFVHEGFPADFLPPETSLLHPNNYRPTVPIPVPFSPSGGGWQLDFEQFRRS